MAYIFCVREKIMSKKINSEHKVDCACNFNVTGGTSDKKNPQIIYYSIGTYITPTKEMDYHTFMSKMEKAIKKEIKDVISERYSCYLEHIVVMEIAEKWIGLGKPSYLDFQIYFKPLRCVIEEEENDFRRLSDRIYNENIIEILGRIQDYLWNGGFILCKAKSKATAIYR